MSASTPHRPGTTERTRRAILDAAVAAYAEDRHAALRDIARAAGVGRSTLHRYFPDRASLVRELMRDAAEATRHSLATAALDNGPPDEALQRLIASMFELGPRLNFLFGETELDDAWDDTEWEESHYPLAGLFVRGQEAGLFDPEIDLDWFVRMLWYTISAGWEGIQEGVMAKHRALALVTRSLQYGVRGTPEGQ